MRGSAQRWAADGARRVTGIGSRYAAHTRLIALACPGWGLVALLCTVFDAAAIVVSMVATGHLVGALPAALRDGVGSASADRVWLWFAVFAALNVGAQLVGGLAAVARAHVSARYVERVYDLLAEAGVAPRGIEHLDSPGMSGRLLALIKETRGWLFRMGVEQGWQVVQTRLVGIGAVIVLIGWRWWAPFVVAASFMLLSKVFADYVDTFFSTQHLEQVGDLRRADYVRSLLTQAEAAKEVRLFGLSGWLVQRYRATWSAANKVLWAGRNRALLPIMGACLVVLVTIGGSLAVLAHDAFTGAVGIALIYTMIQALLGLEAFGIVGDAQTGLAQLTSSVRELVAVRRSAGLPDLRPAPEPPPARPVRAGAAAVTFDRVEFSYPTRDTATLRSLSLHIPAGQSIAVVGVNGAGKSTLIKLLSGLYPPGSGRVCIDDADPFTDETARARVAVIFQDFIRYPLALRDNVGFGALDRRGDQAVLDRALADAGGVDLLDRLESGWDTVLSREYDGGTDLSGGQWQRVALARALAAVTGGAGVLVLDEPTAALDVRAEAALFDRFLDVTRGVTTILVSHRLSSVRHAQRIVVLDGVSGTIVEDGSHDELISRGGEYADMFALQARRFAQAGGDGVPADPGPATGGEAR